MSDSERLKALELEIERLRAVSYTHLSFFAHLFYKLINKISDIEIMDGARDYRLMSRKFVDSLLSLREYNRFSKGLFAWVGFKTRWIEFENVERVAGETKWSFGKLLLYSFEGITAFSTAPLAIAALLGMGLFICSFIMILMIIVRTLLFGAVSYTHLDVYKRQVLPYDGGSME